MIALELWHLKRFCRKHGLDIQEVDNTLTYAENKKHLQALTGDPPSSDVWESQLEEYMTKHLLESHILASKQGETKSTETGKTFSPRFSLKLWTQKHSPSFSGGVKHCLL